MEPRLFFALTSLSILLFGATCVAADIQTVISDEDLMFVPFEPYLPCADGSPAGIYRESHPNSKTISQTNHVMVFLGGGVCGDEDDCNEKMRSSEAFLFSSDLWPRTIKGHTLLSRNSTENPVASNFTRWIVPYCSQDLFFGSNDSSMERQLSRWGDNIFEAALNTMKDSFGNSAIDTLIVGGISAGSIGLMNHIESVQNVSRDANVENLRLILDSGSIATTNQDGVSVMQGAVQTIAYDIQKHPLCNLTSSTQELQVEGSWNIPCCTSIHCMLEHDPVLRSLAQSDDIDGRERLLILDSVYDPVAIVSTAFMEPAERSTTPSISDLDAFASKILELGGERRKEFIQSAYGSKSQLGKSVLWAVTNVVSHPFLLPALEIEQLRCGANEKGYEVYGLEEPDVYGHFIVCKEDGLGVRTELIHDLTGTMWQTTDSWNLCTVDGKPVQDIIYGFVYNETMTHGLVRDVCSGPNCVPIGSTEPNPAQVLFVLDDEFISISRSTEIFLLCASVCLVLTYLLRVLPVKLVERAIREKKDCDATSKTTKESILMSPEDLTNGTIKISHVSVNVRDSEKMLLKDLSFSLPPGTITALIGSSGAGKSTLLNLLCGQLPSELQGFQRDTEFKNLGIQTSYLRQFGNSSFQNIELSAYLDLTAKLYGVSSSELESVVTFLKKSFADRVGEGPNFGGIKIRQLSGGQQRIVAIVTTMLTRPKLFLLDEPISGLDSVSSQLIMKFLQDLAEETSSAILMTLHQPSDAILEQIDRTLVLREGKLVLNDKVRSSAMIHDALEELARGEEVISQRPRLGNFSEFHGFKRSRNSVLGDVSEESEANTGMRLSSLCQIKFDFWQIQPLMRRLHLEHGHDYVKILEAPICYIFFTVLLRFDRGSPVQFLFTSALFCIAPSFIYVPLLLQTCESYNAHMLELQDGRISSHAFMLASFFYIMSMPICSIGLGITIGYGILGWNFATYSDQFLFACLNLFSSFQLGRVLILLTDGTFSIVEQLFVLYTSFSVVMSGGLVSPNKLPPYIRWLNFLSVSFWSITGISLVHFEQGTMLNLGETCSSLQSCVLQNGVFLARAFGYTPIATTRLCYVVLLSMFFFLFATEYVLIVRKYGSKRKFDSNFAEKLQRQEEECDEEEEEEEEIRFVNTQ